ncbi:beta-ketoacyl synthase N-terminal-like domain-containing protein [Marinimicrobium sp. ABcell2]|uniref:beta-ketoacyl synthase N-terminal-like domain-containing protein n=1 Tax=Marinimicrobium sp. ABcell2 TaxID=3069751 RepID=UPI0027B54102|nr:beta-ketoacyl synthase N-terminal-like domain-containing protein [Marinimicrobium sp. ABcell2]MDQ2076984.1 beta-ketoacyl synthase N-terminal-like domain-containing protein [Marinimicrobium sp. ABcell2]
MKVSSSYSLLHTIDADAEGPLPALEPLITRWHGSRIRRIDRYIQLCIAGGLNCVADKPLEERTGLYLASRAGAVSTSAKAMINTEQKGEMPKPLHFVNTLGNSAGFYLTQLLGLTGTVLVVSQEWLSFESALLHAWLDLHQGRVDAALVGGFDEVCLPTAHHLERLGEQTTQLTEGSHWLLLEREAPASGVSLEAPNWFADSQELAHWISTEAPFDWIQTGFGPSPDERSLLASNTGELQAFTRPAALHGVFSGAALVSLCEQLAEGQKSGRALHLVRGTEGPYGALVVTC